MEDVGAPTSPLHALVGMATLFHRPRVQFEPVATPSAFYPAQNEQEEELLITPHVEASAEIDKLPLSGEHPRGT